MHDHLPFHQHELDLAFGVLAAGSSNRFAAVVIYGSCGSNPGEPMVRQPNKDMLSGLVVAFAMIPEAIFSGIAGVDPKERSVCRSPLRWWAVA